MKMKPEVVLEELQIFDDENFKVDLLFNSASSQAFDKATKFASMVDSLTSVDYNEDKLVFQLKSDPEQPHMIEEFIHSDVFGGLMFIVLNKHTDRPTLFMWMLQNSTILHGSNLPDAHAPILHCYCQVYNFPLPYIEITEVQEHEQSDKSGQ